MLCDLILQVVDSLYLLIPCSGIDCVLLAEFSKTEYFIGKGYSYQSKYQGQKYYVQMMYKTPSQVAAQEYSFEMNAHNRTLLSQIQRASRSADAMRLYPGAFSETLVQLMKEKKLSNKKLAD